MTVRIEVELDKKEFMAVAEFARMCGEPVPQLIRKLIIREATLADGYGTQDSDYEFRMHLPVESSLAIDNNTLEEGYNRIRRIMGWSEIRL